MLGGQLRRRLRGDDADAPALLRPDLSLVALLFKALPTEDAGARTAAQYRRLCATVGRIIETDHHALAVRFDEPSQQWALRSYRLRELDRYTG